MRVAQEETFGPLAPVFRFQDEQDVIRQANASEFGLAAYVFSRDHARIWRVADAGSGHGWNQYRPDFNRSSSLWRNQAVRQWSGRLRYGIEDYLEIKYLCMGGIE
jgi:succinate-semialdehyde dehydrogenase/glutarate-semialdehyde dehydrogenase